MADSTPVLEQIAQAQAQKEVTANALFAAMSGSAIFGRHAEACAGLVWGWYGGRWGGTAIANDTETLGGSTTTYMVVDRATGDVSFDTATADWDDDDNFGRAYKLVTGSSTVTSYEDHRAGVQGIFAASAATATLAGILAALGDPDATMAANSDDLFATQKATKTAIASALAGIAWKAPVRVASTVNGTLATAFENGDTLDGVTLATGNRILLKNQSTASDNGIYVVAASGAPTRATDADSGAELLNASVFVEEGTQADTQWVCTTNATITVGSTSLTFVQFGAVTLDADLTTIAALTPTNDDVLQFKSSAWANRTIAQLILDLQGTGLVSGSVGFRHIPQNSQSTAYTTVAADAGKHILHPSADTTARIYTIDSNANVAYPIGTAITFVNQNGAGVITISITSDTMRLAGAGTTGSRTLAANGIATALKVASTEWIISGTGLT